MQRLGYPCIHNFNFRHSPQVKSEESINQTAPLPHEDEASRTVPALSIFYL